MKKIILIFIILFLIIVTTLTKNSTIKLESQIFLFKENLSVLENNYELILLEHNYLSSPQKLFEYQSSYFENDFINIDINNVKKITQNGGEILILDFNKTQKDNE